MADADTVTPLDGDGKNATTKAGATSTNSTPPPEPAAPVEVEQPDERVSADDYKTQGRTKVATRFGYQHEPANKNLPVITPEGVLMTREEADAVVEGSFGDVFIVDESQEG